jgi:phosphoadenosine phosphosulfate reductase
LLSYSGRLGVAEQPEIMSPSIDSEYVENERRPGSISSEDSEYGTMPSSAIFPEVLFTSTHLKFLNRQLSMLEPEEILRWCLITLPGLYQTTALGLSGMLPSDLVVDCKD